MSDFYSTLTDRGMIAYGLRQYVEDQRRWSETVFGPGPRTVGICNHIRCELHEIEANPADEKEWLDVIILAMDGYWRAGGNTGTLLASLLDKQQVNFKRQWPSQIPGQNEAIFHIKEAMPMSGVAEGMHTIKTIKEGE